MLESISTVDLKIALAGLVVVLIGVLLYERSKRRSAEALNDNIETKEKIDEVQRDVIKNEALMEAERLKRDEINKKLEEDKKKDVSKDDLLDFFNKSDK